MPGVKNLLALICLLVLVLAIAAGVRSASSWDQLEWNYTRSGLVAGPVRTQTGKYVINLSRGEVAFVVVREDWSQDVGGTAKHFYFFSGSPRNLIALPSPQFVHNEQFAGFQFYSLNLPSVPVPGAQADVHAIVLPLWPLLLTAIPPALWLRRRRATRARGFPMAAPESRI